jgi:hypothetical protein
MCTWTHSRATVLLRGFNSPELIACWLAVMKARAIVERLYREIRALRIYEGACRS